MVTQSLSESDELPEALHATCCTRHLDTLDADIVHDYFADRAAQRTGPEGPTVVAAQRPSTGEIGNYYRNLCADVRLVAISADQQQIAGDVTWAGMVRNALTAATTSSGQPRATTCCSSARFSPEKGAHLAIDAARSAGRLILLVGKLQDEEEGAYSTPRSCACRKPQLRGPGLPRRAAEADRAGPGAHRFTANITHERDRGLRRRLPHPCNRLSGPAEESTCSSTACPIPARPCTDLLTALPACPPLVPRSRRQAAVRQAWRWHGPRDHRRHEGRPRSPEPSCSCIWWRTRS